MRAHGFAMLPGQERLGNRLFSHVCLQPLKELPPPGQLLKDKFLVQACQTTAATDDAKAIFESKDKDEIIDQKLVCTFNIPSADISVEEQDNSAINTTGT